MAKCFNCGKIFDYEKHYGICPKCGTYNKEKLEEMHEELHQKNQPQKASGASIAVLVCLIIGVVAGVLFPVGYFVVKSFDAVENIMEREDLTGLLQENNDSEYYEGYEEDFYYEPENQVPQNPEIITVNPGETFSIGTEKTCTISVESTEVVVKAGIISDFPAGENLVAVKVNYENFENEDIYYDYNPVYTLYVGYNGSFKRAIEEYMLTDYEDFLPQMNFLDNWELTNDADGSGVFLFFVPVDVTELNFYVESRSEETNDIVKIYSVPLQINTGEEL